MDSVGGGRSAPEMADNAVFGAPPDLSRNLDFLMNLLPTLARAGNSANPQDIFEEFVNDPASSGFREFAQQAGLPDVLGLAMELLGPDATGGAGDAAKLAPALGMAVPGLLRKLHRFADDLVIEGAPGARTGQAQIGDYRINFSEDDKSNLYIDMIENLGEGRGRAGLAHALRAVNEEGVTLSGHPAPFQRFDLGEGDSILGPLPVTEDVAATNRLIELYRRLGFGNPDEFSALMIRPPGGFGR
jgi:hypothetical protein